MLTKRNLLGAALLVVVVTVLATGCPGTPPNRQPAIIVTPDSLDFGVGQDQMTFTVSKVWTSRGLPAIRITSPVPWLTVTPQSRPSAGPQDPIEVVATLNRNLLPAIQNTTNVLVRAEGVQGASLPVTAQSALAAGFIANPPFSVVNEPIQFTDTSLLAEGQSAISSWLWEFGDGTTSTEQNPQHTYTQTGTYTVALTIGNGSITKTFLREDYILVVEPQAPIVSFTYAVSETTSGDFQVLFADQSVAVTGDLASWQWDFGDGNTSTEQNPLHVYQGSGPDSYEVTLTVTTDQGQSGSTTQTVSMFASEAPLAEFEGSPTTVTSGNEVQFTDLSDPRGSQITSWQWDFGDGNTSTTQNPTHIYQIAAAYAYYDVSLTVTNAFGSDSEIKPEYITVLD
jgi:PKD repeat protein